MNDEKLLRCINIVLQTENLLKHNIKITGSTKKGDGYFSQIFFVQVNGTISTEEKTWNFVIKASTSNELARKQIPISQLYQTEINIYEKVVPNFRKLQPENDFNLLPRCYLSQTIDNMEILIFDNLKRKGFGLWDRKIPMDFEHVRLLLEAYGKWHAYSLTLKRRKFKHFEKIVKKEPNMFNDLVLNKGLDEIICKNFEKLKEVWKDEPEIQKVTFSNNDVKKLFSEFGDPLHHAILHGDGWTNNFMFKSNENNRPTEVCIIDWQCSTLGPPVFDLSYFIYGCVDTGIHSDVTKLLEIYYNSLRKKLEWLSFNCGVVFPFEKLLDDWKKFSAYGLAISTYLLKFSLSESEEVPDFVESVQKGERFLDNFDFAFANKNAYLERMRNNILHYVRNT